jgi:uncharacterized membrane protein
MKMNVSIEKKQTILLILFVVATNAAVLSDMPIFRQVFGGIFLTFLPGLFILSILRLNDINQVKKIILTIGLSLSFTMCYGLLVNTLFLSVGFVDALSIKWLLLTFNFALITLYCLNWIINKGKIITFQIHLDQTLNKNLAMLSIMTIFPSLSIFGAYIMRTNGNNIVLMCSFFLIIFIMIFMAIVNKEVPKNIYPILIYSIGIFITLAFTLRSEYIVGADVHSEYYLFRITLDNLHWKIVNYSALDACLSISLLPAIYQSIMNVANNTFFYKFFYSVFIPIAPLAIFEISKKYVDEIFAFYAALFFASNHTFMWTAANARTNLAILFFTLAIMVLFMDINSIAKRFLFIIFQVSIILSHYSTAYIFFFVSLAVWAQMKLIKIRYSIVENISGTSVLLFSALIFFWYSQITKGAFDYSAMGFFRGTITSFSQTFLVDSRGGALPEVLGVGFTYSNLSRQIHIVIQWIVMFIMVVGIINLIENSMKNFASYRSQNYIAPLFRLKIEVSYVLLALACFGILVFCVMVPQASTGLGTDRVYLQMMGVLAFVLILGCIHLSKYTKIKPLIIILIVLIPYFMANTGVLYQLNSIPNEPTLTSKGFLYNTYYIQKSDMTSAKWLSEYYNPQSTMHYISLGENLPFEDLKSQKSRFIAQYTEIREHPKIEGYLYLGYLAVVKGIFITKSRFIGNFNTSEYPEIFNVNSKIYNNGGSEIYSNLTSVLH